MLADTRGGWSQIEDSKKAWTSYTSSFFLNVSGGWRKGCLRLDKQMEDIWFGNKKPNY
jgi:hypothetical protein